VWEPILSLEILEKYMRNMLNYVNILLPEVSQGVGTNIIIGNIGKIYEKHA